ncbi:testis-specific basic protein Y 1-like [Saccopteryx bilineata]|uniref:testis-specific basic protein Y 1-like n=1 Tax=Saccopteryx bilineata TaxID=59482 RepID=UPI00338F04B5
MSPPPPPPPRRRRFPRRGPGAAANRCGRPCGGSVVPAAGPGARCPAVASPGASLRRGPAAPERGRRGRRPRLCAAAAAELMSGGAAPGPAAGTPALGIPRPRGPRAPPPSPQTAGTPRTSCSLPPSVHRPRGPRGPRALRPPQSTDPRDHTDLDEP